MSERNYLVDVYALDVNGKPNWQPLSLRLILSVA